jgi:uncharacterized protein (DUF362 family)/Pyruvate/2-oxoacid:ferredoxin oxidoreductase delta subunit
MSGKARVVLLRCDEYDVDPIRNKIESGFSLLGGIRPFFKEKERILLKPNLLAPDAPDMATTTHPAVFEALARVLLDNGIALAWGDSPGFHSLQKVAKKAGILDCAQKLGIPTADFKEKTRVVFERAAQNRVFEIARGVVECDGIVSIPKLKTHGLTLFTGSIKNQFGCIPGMAKPGFHAKLEDPDRFSQMLVDLTMYLRPRLYLMDGIVAMEGNGPRRGSPVALGALLMSDDPVALDTVACRLIRLDPRKVAPIVLGDRTGLGTMSDIEVLGDSVDALKRPFKLPRYSGNFKSIPPFIRNALKKIMTQVPAIDRKKCVKCHECHGICPTIPKSIFIDDERYPRHVYRTCIRCYCCQEICPANAISIRFKLL